MRYRRGAGNAALVGTARTSGVAVGSGVGVAVGRGVHVGVTVGLGVTVQVAGTADGEGGAADGEAGTANGEAGVTMPVTSGVGVTTIRAPDRAEAQETIPTAASITAPAITNHLLTCISRCTIRDHSPHISRPSSDTLSYRN